MFLNTDTIDSRSKDREDQERSFASGLKHTHTRQRSNSIGATFYSSTIVPASHHSEALASLITSLTSISEARATADRRPKTSAQSDHKSVDLIESIAARPDFQKAFYQNSTPVIQAQTQTQEEEDASSHHERDYCPPPVAGYNTINADKLPQRPKTSAGIKIPRRFKDKVSQPHLQASQSHSKLRSNKSSRDLQSPDSLYSVPPRSSYGDESIASLPLSTNSKLSRAKSPFKMFFSQALGTDRNHVSHEPLPLRTDRPDTLKDSFETAHSSPVKDNDRDMRFSAFVTLGRLSADLERKNSDAKTLSSMSPSNRIDLTENLIPSRRSSLRSGPRRSPRGSKDLKSLNIDQDLIEENHETVQRIRELQQAREARHREWRKEAKRSEKIAKRMSVPTSSPSPIQKSGSVRSSWHSKPLDSPEDTPDNEDPPNLSARLTGTDLLTMPTFTEAIEDQPITPVEPPPNRSLDTDLRRRLSTSASTTHSSPKRGHRKRLSDGIKRVGSMRQPPSNDAKGVADEVEAFLASPRLTQKIRHPRTGRTIAFSEVGDPNGFVVFCCVGMGLTRYVTSFYDEIAKAQKLRIITPDRPGVAETDAMPSERSTPLAWVDDVAVICSSLGVDKFSLLAHSAGAIYALAAALKMPQYVRGRIHLLGPWIPPSQLAASTQSGELRAANLPTSHKILSFLPASFMKAANSRFLSATSASIEPRGRKQKKERFLTNADLALDRDLFNEQASLSQSDMNQINGSILPTPASTPQRAGATESISLSAYQTERLRVASPPLSPSSGIIPRSGTLSPTPSGLRTPNVPGLQSQVRALTPVAREKLYNTTLAQRTWALATLDANPAVDLIICLERRRPIGFRYTDITRAVVIHHGVNDTRVPLENVRWLSTAMKRCELRILENEGHGLMASANVMSNVLGEIGKEWEEWSQVAKEREIRKKEEDAREEQAAKEKEKGARRGYPRW